MTAEIDIGQDRRIGRDWVKSLALIAICIGTCIFFVYAAQSEASGYYEQRAKTGAYFILPLMVPFTVWVIFRLFVPFGALILINPQGVADRRVNRNLIPWREISNVVRRGEYTVLTLKPGFLKTYSFNIGQKLLKSRRKTAGPRHMLIAPWSVAVQNHSLDELIETYHATYLNSA